MVEDDKIGRAVLMKNCSQVPLSGGEKYQEERLSGQLMLKVAGSTAMSNVFADKMASVALIRKCSSFYLFILIVNHVIDNFNEKDTAPMCDCVYLPGNCVLCVLHSDSNNDGQKYYHCRKSVGDCRYF